MKQFVAKDWENILTKNNLKSIDNIWDLEVDWFEPPNKRRGGWSGASKLSLKDPDSSDTKIIFLKRQENHFRSSFLPPKFRIASFAKEFYNLKRFGKSGIPVIAPVYFALRKKNKKVQAILATEALTNHSNLIDWDQKFKDKEFSTKARIQLITQIAEMSRKMHIKGYEHGALYGEHIFARYLEDENKFDLQLIDLEFGRRHYNPNRGVRELSRFYKRTPNIITKTDSIRFLKTYLGASSDKLELKEFSQKVQNRIDQRVEGRINKQTQKINKNTNI